VVFKLGHYALRKGRRKMKMKHLLLIAIVFGLAVWVPAYAQEGEGEGEPVVVEGEGEGEIVVTEGEGEGEGEITLPATEADLTLNEWPDYAKVTIEWYRNMRVAAITLKTDLVRARRMGMTTEEIALPRSFVSLSKSEATQLYNEKPTVDSWRASVVATQEE
jgi:hypothetical protein